MEWNCLRGSQKNKKKRTAHGGKMQRLIFYRRISHNELTIVVHLYCIDIALKRKTFSAYFPRQK